MTMGHFPPVSEKCHTWLVDNFLPFLRGVTYVNGTFSSHFWKVSHMTNGHFPPIYKKVSHMTMGHFPPEKSNVTLFRYGRKMSHGHMGRFLEMGGKCPTFICDTFQKWEENVPSSYVTLFRNGRKMSRIHIWNFSETGGKCPTVICDTF